MFNTKFITRAAVVAALYATITLVLNLVYVPQYGPIQFRVSEVLTILPLIMPESIIGLTVGCLIANIFGNGVYDIILGTLATLISAIMTYYIGVIIRKKFTPAQSELLDADMILKKQKKVDYLQFFLGAIPPILVNAFIVPFTFVAFMDWNEVISTYWFNSLTVGIGQAIVILVLGLPFFLALLRVWRKKVQ